MNKDQMKGKITDMKGRAERQVSEWTGDEEGMVHGTSEQIKGKGQKAVGDIKSGAEDLKRRGQDALRELDRESHEEKKRDADPPRGRKVA